MIKAYSKSTERWRPPGRQLLGIVGQFYGRVQLRGWNRRAGNNKYIDLLLALERRLLESIDGDLMLVFLSALMEVLQNPPVDRSFCCRSMKRAEIQKFWWRLVCNVDTWHIEDKCSQHLLHGNTFLAQRFLNQTFPWLLVCMEEEP
jgi:hypothetical protein